MKKKTAKKGSPQVRLAGCRRRAAMVIAGQAAQLGVDVRTLARDYVLVFVELDHPAGPNLVAHWEFSQRGGTFDQAVERVQAQLASPDHGVRAAPIPVAGALSLAHQLGADLAVVDPMLSRCPPLRARVLYLIAGADFTVEHVDIAGLLKN